MSVHLRRDMAGIGDPSLMNNALGRGPESPGCHAFRVAVCMPVLGLTFIMRRAW
jgi:hypothetical protein